MKECRRCHNILPTNRFGPKKGTKDGLRPICRSCHVKDSIERSRKIRQLTLEHYGGNPPKCACCGESNTEFLVIDHINGNGNKHREEIKNCPIHTHLKARGFPDGYRVLCANCNHSLGIWGYCPHQLNSGSEKVLSCLHNDEQLEVAVCMQFSEQSCEFI
jgi:hypothetical protein